MVMRLTQYNVYVSKPILESIIVYKHSFYSLRLFCEYCIVFICANISLSQFLLSVLYTLNEIQLVLGTNGKMSDDEPLSTLNVIAELLCYDGLCCYVTIEEH